MEHDLNDKPKQPCSPVEDEPITDNRREALRKIGKFATYMAPVMLGLVSEKALASP